MTEAEGGPTGGGPSEWMARALRQHPEVLSLRERLRPLSKAPPSFGRNHRKAARTEVAEVLSPPVVLQLVLQYLHEEGLVQTRDALLEEAKTACPELLDAIGASCSDDVTGGGTSAAGAAAAPKRGFSEASLDPVFQRAMLPLLRLGVRDLATLFASVPTAGDDADAEEDPEVEAAEAYPGELDVEDDDEEASDVNVWDEARAEGSNSLFKADGPAPELVAGTLNQLVAWLTDPLSQDRVFHLTFFLCYPAFVTADKLVAKLVQRYHKPAGSAIQEQEKVVLALSALRLWIEKYPFDFVGSVYDQLSHFVRATAEKETSVQFKQLLVALAHLDEIDRSRPAAEDEEMPRLQQTEPPVVPKNIFSPRLTLDDIDEAEISRQMCLIDFRLYWRIKPREMLGCLWRKEPARASNVVAAMKRSSELTIWATHCIVHGRWAEGATCDRPKMYGKLVRLCYLLYKGNNFFAAWALYNALSSGAIQRLMRSSGGAVGGISSSGSLASSRRGGPAASFLPDAQSMMTELSLLFSSDNNYSQYRRTARQTRVACVPDLLLHLRDLAIIEDGMPAKINGTMINFHKYVCTARIINDFLSHRSVVYPLQQVDQITSLLKDWSDLPDEKTLMEQALNAQRE